MEESAAKATLRGIRSKGQLATRVAVWRLQDELSVGVGGGRRTKSDL